MEVRYTTDGYRVRLKMGERRALKLAAWMCDELAKVYQRPVSPAEVLQLAPEPSQPVQLQFDEAGEFVE